MLRFLVVICLFGLSFFAYSQNNLSTKSKKAAKLFYEAEAMITVRQYPNAIVMLEEAVKKDENFVEAQYKLGFCYKVLKNYDKAEIHLKKALALKPNNKEISGLYFHWGELRFKLNDYIQAAKYLEQFLGFSSHGYNYEIAKPLLENSKFAIEKMQNKLDFDPSPLSDVINQYTLQYFPVLTVDQNNLFYTRRLGVTPQFDEDIVVSVKNEDGEWTAPRSISENINTRFNEGTCAISADGRTLIFTSCLGRINYGSCDLFITYKIGDDWSEPENVGGIINSRAWDSQPSLSADGRTLYFVSDRNAGYGKKDIWMSTMNNDDDWTKPVNLGPKINTAKDEVSPFIHANGQTLYFASEGMLGFGGFDIYYAEFGESGWSFPENLGYPINTSDDQVSLFITADGKKGYYSHENIMENRRTYGKIYSFDIPEPIQVKNKSNFVKGRVFDAKTKKVLKANIELYDLKKQELKSLVHSDPITGQYMMVLTEGSEYALYVDKPNYLFHSLSFDYLENINLDPITIDIFLQPIEKGMKTTLKNIFFDFNKYEIKEKSEVELNKVINFLENNVDIKIQIEGHTDNKGTEEYNMNLSLKRAEAIHNYLIEAGVLKDRIQYKGFGQSKPVAPNDSEENRALNRRIEFEII